MSTPTGGCSMSEKQQRRRRQATQQDGARYVWDVLGRDTSVQRKVEVMAFSDYLIKRLYNEPADPPATMTRAQVAKVERACATPERRARVLTWALGLTVQFKVEVQQWVDAGEGGAEWVS